MKNITQSFVKGINRASTRQDSINPDFFYSLENARVLQEGNIGEVTRIDGYSAITSNIAELDVLYDIKSINNLFFVFYKGDEAISGGEYTFYIRVYNSSGVHQTVFTYTDSVFPEKGELKQYDDTVFIAPHNKVIFEKEGTYYLKDFISKPTKIKEIDTTDINATTASVEVTFNTGLTAYGGRPSKGYIIVNNNNIPAGVSDTVQVSIGGTSSGNVVLDGTMSKEEIAQILTDEINSSFTDWDAELIAPPVVEIEHTDKDAQFNDTVIDIVGRSYISVEGEVEGAYFTNPNGFQSILEGFPTTIKTIDTYGGIDGDTASGSISITLKDALITEPITVDSTDTTTDIATKVETILNGSPSVVKRYTISRTTNVVTLTAKKKGSRYSTGFILNINSRGDDVIELPDNFYSVSGTLGTDEQPEGTLEANTYYWYKGRFKYIDGHITPACSSALSNSDANRYIEVTFDLEGISDLDDNYPRLQVFRKKEGEEFFLIEEVDLDQETIINDEFVFVDEGYSKQAPFNEQNLVWTKQHKTQEVVDNKLVKANVEFFNEAYSISSGDFTLSTLTDADNDDVAPIKSKVEMYARPQYTDGTLGYFTNLGRVDISSENKRLTVQQNNLISGEEKTINEIRFYGKYLPYSKEENFTFNTVEIQTPNLEGITEPDILPTRTKILYGYKYIIVREVGGAAHAYVSLRGWNGNETENELRHIGKVESGSLDANGNPVYIRGGIIRLTSLELFVNVHGSIKKYIPIARDFNGVDVYKLEEFEALKEATSTGELFVRLNRTNESGLSRTVNDDSLLNLSVKVLGIDDTSTNSNFDINKSKFYVPEDGTTEDDYLLPSEDSRIYLLLDESELDEIDNNYINKYNFGDYDRIFSRQISETGTLAFDLINFQKDEDSTFDTNTFKSISILNRGSYRLFEYEDAKFTLINKEVALGDSSIYLGKKDNVAEGTPVELYTTGFTYEDRSNLVYSLLSEYNIYETPLFESDFNFNRTSFGNQLIWSSPLIDNNYFAGGRSYDVNNFFNIPTENGKIIDIVSYNGRLYVFCETGVAQVLIGETLTQQKSGNVVVDSSGFMTKSLWMLENTPTIKVGSIIKSEGNIYFTDGNDVFTISGQGIDNITQGKLLLDHDVDYVSTYIKKYDEYRLSNPDTGETFVFNTKYKQWYGPFTYVPEKTVELGGNIYSWVSTDLMEEDTGNTFNGTAYNTTIQSVANDTQIGNIDKTYRKFYLDVSGDETDVNTDINITENRITNTTFKYGKDFSSMISKDLDAVTSGESTVAVKNGWYHFGINPDEGNTKKIFWDIVTTNPNFSLRGLITAFMIRRRR